MYILAFETTGPICSVALLDLENDGRVFMLNGDEPMSHLRDLTANARKLMEDNGIKMGEIAAVASSIGPGSFTGIRIGVTTSRAVAQALSVPCVQVPTLEVFKEKVQGNIVAPIFNARRGQVYGAVFADERDVMPPGPYMLEDVLGEIKKYCNLTEGEKNIVFYGDGIDAYMERLTLFKTEIEEAFNGSVKIDFSDASSRYQTADMVARFAKGKLERGETVSYEELLPDYMRKAEAEQKLEDGTLKKLREEKLARLLAGN